MKKYIVTLSEEERTFLEGVIAKAKASAYKQSHARILLKADQSAQGPQWTDERIAEALEIGHGAVERARRRFVEEGLEAAIERKAQQNRYRKMDGEPLHAGRALERPVRGQAHRASHPNRLGSSDAGQGRRT